MLIISLSLCRISPSQRSIRSKFLCNTHNLSAAYTTSTPPPPPPHPQSITPPPHFSDFPLDRRSDIRKQFTKDLQQHHLSEPGSILLIFHQRKALVINSTPNTHDVLATDRNSTQFIPKTFDDSPAQRPDGGPPLYHPCAFHPLYQDILDVINQDIGYIFLGMDDQDNAVFACDVISLPTSIQDNIAAPTIPNDSMISETFAPLSVIDVRAGGQNMCGKDAAVLAFASGLLDWHKNSLYCSKTGSKTIPDSGGHSRVPQTRSTSDKIVERKKRKVVYPRIDPAVIVTVASHNDDFLLLGRKSTWDIGRYSLLAGFAEMSESLESAVYREIYEESGVKIKKSSIQYHSSQPWPFPRSLMIGFSCTACTACDENDGLEVLPLRAQRAAREVGLLPEEAERYRTLPAVHVDEDELEDARWFHRDWLTRRLSDDTMKNSIIDSDNPINPINDGLDSDKNSVAFRIPGRYALAHRMIMQWLEDTSGLHIKYHSSESLSKIKDVSIDTGVFKYVLLRVVDPNANLNAAVSSKLIVRGDGRAAYHNNIYLAAKNEICNVDPALHVETVGGGRMEHYAGVLSVYGYSAAFGQAPHDVTAVIVKRLMPMYDIGVSYDGY